MKSFTKFIIYSLILSIIIIIIYFIFIRHSLFGYSCLKVLTGSMEPDIKTGENIIIKKCKEYKVGDIITYITEEGELVTHRIISIEGEEYSTKGDANNTCDSNPILIDQIYGKVIFHFSSFFHNSFYSFAKYFNSSKASVKTQIAKPIFIVDGDKEILIEQYGTNNNYNFTVRNHNENGISDVSFNYKIEIIADKTIKTQLFRDDNLLDINETFTLSHSTPVEHKYLLKIEAPEDYNGKVKVNVVAYQMEEVKS